jgi:hypothetical protein
MRSAAAPGGAEPGLKWAFVRRVQRRKMRGAAPGGASLASGWRLFAGPIGGAGLTPASRRWLHDLGLLAE